MGRDSHGYTRRGADFDCGVVGIPDHGGLAEFAYPDVAADFVGWAGGCPDCFVELGKPPEAIVPAGVTGAGSRVGTMVDGEIAISQQREGQTEEDSIELVFICLGMNGCQGGRLRTIDGRAVEIEHPGERRRRCFSNGVRVALKQPAVDQRKREVPSVFVRDDHSSITKFPAEIGDQLLTVGQPSAAELLRWIRLTVIVSVYVALVVPAHVRPDIVEEDPVPVLPVDFVEDEAFELRSGRRLRQVIRPRARPEPYDVAVGIPELVGVVQGLTKAMPGAIQPFDTVMRLFGEFVAGDVTEHDDIGIRVLDQLEARRVVHLVLESQYEEIVGGQLLGLVGREPIGQIDVGDTGIAVPFRA